MTSRYLNVCIAVTALSAFVAFAAVAMVNKNRGGEASPVPKVAIQTDTVPDIGPLDRIDPNHIVVQDQTLRASDFVRRYCWGNVQHATCKALQAPASVQVTELRPWYRF